MGVVDESVEDGVGEGRMIDRGVPVRHRQLAGDDRRTAAVALLQDLEQVVAGPVVERLEPPVVEDQQLLSAERPEQPSVAAVAAGQRQIGEQLGHPLVQDRAVVAAGVTSVKLVVQRQF